MPARHLLTLVLIAALGGCISERTPYQVPTAMYAQDLAFTPANVPAYCAVKDDTVLQRAPIPEIPRWFFKPMPDGPLVGFLGTHGNNLFNLDTGRVIPIPGTRDAIPTPDGLFVTLPGIVLMPTEELLDEQREGPVTRLLATMRGEYQSPGVLSRDGTGVVYRFITDDEGPVARDFLVELNPSSPRMKALGRKHRLCPNTFLKLPMLSMDGREFAAFNVHSRATKIYRIDDDFGCEEIDSLGFPTGKVSFSFDGRYLAFHLGRVAASTARMSWVPEDHLVHNVFVYDRATRALGRLTHNTASNSYYPAFRRDGTLVYLFKPFADSGGRFNFVVADPGQIRRWVPIEWVKRACGDNDDPSCYSALVLGSLWAHTCSEYGHKITAQAAILNTLSLDGETCHRLVADNWSANRDKVLATVKQLVTSTSSATPTDTELFAACPETNPSAGASPIDVSPGWPVPPLSP